MSDWIVMGQQQTAFNQWFSTSRQASVVAITKFPCFEIRLGGMFWERLEPDCGSEGWDIGVGLDTLLRDSR